MNAPLDDGLFLGATRGLEETGPMRRLLLPSHHLTTHGVILGMTGSGKTGVATVMVEEAAQAQIPVLLIDVKGDLANLLLAFDNFDPGSIASWVEPGPKDKGPNARELLASKLAADRQNGLNAWGIDAPRLGRYCQSTYVRVITPGADAGELLHVLSSLERRSSRWDHDVEGARAALSAAISLILRLLGRDSDPARSRERSFRYSRRGD